MIWYIYSENVVKTPLSGLVRYRPMRIRYYDWLEALAIFIVLSFHQVWLPGTAAASFSMAFVPMAVPLFFMVHGALLFSREASPKKQVRRFLRVLGQMYAWNTVYLLVSLVIGLAPLSEVTPEFLFRFYFCKADCSGITSGHLWFIYALLVLYCLYPVLDACRKHNDKVLRYVMAACFVLSFVREELLTYSDYLCRVLFDTPLVTEWVLSKVAPYFNAVFYFVSGYYYSNWLRDNEKLKANRKKYIILSALALLGGAILLMAERYVVFGTINYNWKPLPQQYEKLATLIMSFSCFTLFSLIDFKESRAYAVAKAISVHSLDIFYIHVIYARIFRVFLFRYSWTGVWQNYLRAAVILVLSYFTGQLLRRIPVVKKLL